MAPGLRSVYCLLTTPESGIRLRSCLRPRQSGLGCRWAWNCWLALLSVSLLVTLAPPTGARDVRRNVGRARSPRRASSRHPLIQSLHDPTTAKHSSHSNSDYYHRTLHRPNAAVIEKASHLELSFLLGHKIVLVCVARGIPRPKITWLKDGVQIAGHPYVQISEWLREDNRIKSKLEIDPARQMDSGNYECQADNKISVDRRLFKAEHFADLPPS